MLSDYARGEKLRIYLVLLYVLENTISVLIVFKICSQLEEYLLSLGWKFLERKIKSSKIVLKVYLKLCVNLNGSFIEFYGALNTLT
jgi:hypothetical protein